MIIHNIFFALLLTAGLSVGVYAVGPETVIDEARSFIGMEEVAPAFVRPPATAEEIPQAAPPHADLSTELQEVTCEQGWHGQAGVHYRTDEVYDISWEGGGITYYKTSDSVYLSLDYGTAGSTNTEGGPQCITCTYECYSVRAIGGYGIDPQRTCVLGPLPGGFGPVEIKVNGDVYLVNIFPLNGNVGASISIREAFGDEVCPGEQTLEEANAHAEAQLGIAAD